MIAWRVCRERYADLSGEGARRNGGRWNAQGLAMVYLSEHPSLALLEVMVHLDLTPDFIPDDYILMTVTLPDEMPTQRIDHSSPPVDERRFGSVWLTRGDTPLLWVPSVLVPQSYNILLNPRHALAAEAQVKSVEPLKLDPRFF